MTRQEELEKEKILQEMKKEFYLWHKAGKEYYPYFCINQTKFRRLWAYIDKAFELGKQEATERCLKIIDGLHSIIPSWKDREFLKEQIKKCQNKNEKK